MPRRVGSPIASSALKILRGVERERGPQTDVLEDAQRRRAVVASRRPERKRQGAVDLAMRSDRATAIDVRAMLAHRSRDSGDPAQLSIHDGEISVTTSGRPVRITRAIACRAALKLTSCSGKLVHALLGGQPTQAIRGGADRIGAFRP
jgi:hypothetical protein